MVAYFTHLVYIYIYIYMCVCMYVCMYVYMYKGDLVLNDLRWLICHKTKLLGRSNGQRELNPFLFLFWVLVWTHENETRLCVAARSKDDFKIQETNVELIYLFPMQLWHTTQSILINVLYTIQYVFVLENKCSRPVNCEYSIPFSTMSAIDFLHSHNHLPYSSKGKIFCKTHYQL